MEDTRSKSNLLSKCPHLLIMQTEVGQDSICLKASIHLQDILAYLIACLTSSGDQKLIWKITLTGQRWFCFNTSPRFSTNPHADFLVCVSLGLCARKARPTRSYLHCSLSAAQEEISAVPEGWQPVHFCLKWGHLQDSAGKGNKHSLSTIAPKNKATMGLLPWKSQSLPTAIQLLG